MTKNAVLFLFYLLPFLASDCIKAQPLAKPTFTIEQNDFFLNGKPFLIKCGEMHFARIPKEYWTHRLKMAKAMGLNTVCAYLFWNLHEPQPNHFNWQGMADAVEFCKLAQQEGLYVILRPGPYSCAEWDFGGLPWWLLKQKGIKVRTQDQYFLERCRIYLNEVGRVLSNFQITNGGPIIMAQVENEYGAYGNDKAYIGKIKDYLVEAGFTIPLFTCDAVGDFKKNVRDDIFSVVNFGSNPQAAFKKLRKVRSKGPLMCGEYYSGWYDSWGQHHHVGSADNMVKDIGYMFKNNASFSIYMVHGGTTFGQWAGANNPIYKPQTSSYDYDAPISEAGWDTEKYYELRKLFAANLPQGDTLPNVPERNNVIAIPEFSTTAIAPIFLNLPEKINSEYLQNMEAYNQSFGSILYRTTLSDCKPSTFKIKQVHDYAMVFINGQKIASLDRRNNENTCKLPATRKGDVLDILVEATGRVNYGKKMNDTKGITQKVIIKSSFFSRKQQKNWQVFPIALSNDEVPSYLKFNTGTTNMPAFHKANFVLEETGDTFLDVSSWGKGLVWVNGHCLGRFWNIGPTQTMYLPAPWLKIGSNEIVVLDYIGPVKNSLSGVVKPILDGLKEIR